MSGRRGRLFNVLHFAPGESQGNAMFEFSRRHLLSGAAAASAAAALTPILAQASGKPHRIDVHHHFSPPEWIASVRGRELLQRANSEWTPERSIEDMDKAG